MNIRSLKNVLALLGYVVTIIAICIVPYMVKWLLSMYVIYLVAVWMGHNEDDHE